MSRDRARGAMIGLAIGDAMGAPTEGMTPESIRAEFGRLDSLAADAAGTDDTEYAVLCARSILRCGSAMTASDVASTWLEATKHQSGNFNGAGFSEMVAIANLNAGYTPPTSGTNSYERWSDGAAMRVTPLGIFAAGNPIEARRLAGIDASVSHAYDGVYCAEAIAAGVATALVTDNYHSVIDAVIAALPPDSWSARLTERALQIAGKSGSADQAIDELYREISLFHYPWADAAPEALALSMGLFSAARGDFRDVVVAAVNIGRDSDTIAAMTGALSGAMIGYEAMPSEWKERVTTVHGRCIADTAGTNLLGLSDQLYELSTAGTRERTPNVR